MDQSEISTVKITKQAIRNLKRIQAYQLIRSRSDKADTLPELLEKLIAEKLQRIEIANKRAGNQPPEEIA